METSRGVGKSSNGSRDLDSRCDELPAISGELPAISGNELGPAGLSAIGTALAVRPVQRARCRYFFVTDKDPSMLAFQIIGGIFVLLFLAAAMTGIEGTEHR